MSGTGGTVTVTLNGTAPASPILIYAYAGPVLITNISPVVTVYLGSDPSAAYTDLPNVVPLGPGGYFVVDGTLPLYGFTAPGLSAQVSVLPTGISAGFAPVPPIVYSYATVAATPVVGPASTTTTAVLPATPGTGYVLYQVILNVMISAASGSGFNQGTDSVTSAQVGPLFVGPAVEPNGSVTQTFQLNGFVMPIGHGLNEVLTSSGLSASGTVLGSMTVQYTTYT